jgi:methyl-accepting chemotaxis protein
VLGFGRKTPSPVEAAAPKAGPAAAVGTVEDSSRDPASQSSGDETARFRNSVDIIEQDVKGALDRLAALSARGMADQTSGELDGIHGRMEELRGSAQTASRDVAELAAAATQVSASVEGVTQNVIQARGAVDEAATMAGQASDIMFGLSTASEEISAMVETIAAIARQTNLLALNATIEAARAGESGRGFAVVAQEVKALSVQTAQRVEEIRKRVQMLEDATARSIDTIAGISRLVTDASPMVSAISDAMQEQSASAGELSRRANQTANFVNMVSSSVVSMDAAAAGAINRSVAASQAAERATIEAESLSRRFVPVIRQSGFADRRVHDRYPAELPVTLTAAGRDWRSTTVDLSEGGLLLKLPENCALKPGDRISVALERMEPLAMRVVAASSLGLHCAIDGMTGDAVSQLAARVAEVATDYAPLIGAAREVAGRISAAMAKLVAERTLSEAQLFDTAYTPVPDTDPQQFETVSLPALRAVLPAICEPPLEADKRLVFCLAIDRNGYIPVHNRIYSQPQRKGDTVWNTANCRDRRIFDDRSGIIAARSVRPFVVQSYRRDMGGGAFVVMREIDVPLFVNDRHWGGLRMAYRF